MISQENGKGRVPRRQHFFWRVLGEIKRNLLKGIRALGTPKGILATVPLVISAFAFAKASYSETRLNLVLNEPISMEATLFPREDGNQDVGPVVLNNFEFLLLADGNQAVYINEMKINIVKYSIGATFDDSCNYNHAWLSESGGGGSQEVVKSDNLSVKVLITTYPFQLTSGFVVSAGNVLPLSGSFQRQRDPVQGEMLEELLGEVPMEVGNQRVEELLLDHPGEPVALCISGIAFVPGGPRQLFKWAGDSIFRTVLMDQSSASYGPSPAGPEGRVARARIVKKLSFRIPELHGGYRLFAHGSWRLFL